MIAKVPKGCIFCGASDLSKEHVWADWIRDYVPRSFLQTEHLVESIEGSLHNRSMSRAVKEGPLHNNGDPASRKLRVVCRGCNNGWMSRLQERAKPILIPLLIGDQWRLDLEAQYTLASWATMFTLVYESGVPDAAGTPVEAFRLFASNQEPLGYWVISFASYAGEHWKTKIETYSSMVKLAGGLRISLLHHVARIRKRQPP